MCLFADKRYRDSKEEDTRKQIFGENVEFIVKHNEKYAKGAETYTMGINQFTDMVIKSFQSGYDVLIYQHRKQTGANNQGPNYSTLVLAQACLPPVHNITFLK